MEFLKIIKNTLEKLEVKEYLLVFMISMLFLSEIVLNFNRVIGFLLYFTLIAVYLISLSYTKDLNNYGKLTIVLLIIPIVRVIGLFIALSFFWKILISYSVLLFLAFYYSIRFKLDHGHKKEKLKFLPLAIIIGIVLGFIGDYFFNLNLSNYTWMIYLIPLIAYSEEILFRGMMQNLIEKQYGTHISILIPSLLYGLFSFSLGLGLGTSFGINIGILFGLFMFITSIILSLTYYKTKNIFLTVIMSIILHYFLFSSILF